mmetsp:Transcript_1685/g.5917  ORF Transcript_1685/g.5917 Transcript_1685/m.5917 type:complete len:110 (+) Transcript_1685:268-597(+)
MVVLIKVIFPNWCPLRISNNQKQLDVHCKPKKRKKCLFHARDIHEDASAHPTQRVALPVQVHGNSPNHPNGFNQIPPLKLRKQLIVIGDIKLPLWLLKMLRCSMLSHGK